MEFGSVKLAKVVVEHDTGRSRGTAFVQFFNKLVTYPLYL
jgi:RNA recognition motif-containing protein